MSDCIKTDVFISGGGPVGLLIAYSLARQGVQSVLVGKTTPSPPSISLQQRIIMHQNLTKAEQHNKENQAMYGRATTLYPRTLEMLDQLDLLEDLNQIGYIGRNSVTYKDGKRVTSRGWHVMFERMHGTYLDYCLNLRQKYSEGVFGEAYAGVGGRAFVGWVLEGFVVDDDSAEGDYRVVSRMREVETGRVVTVKR